jgi:copper resistance protein B
MKKLMVIFSMTLPVTLFSAASIAETTNNQESMSMQGGSAPANARDPNAYSGGYTLDRGPYALPGPRELKLADEEKFGRIWIERLERGFSKDAPYTGFEGQAWFGSDINRLSLKVEGDYSNGVFDESRNEALWAHAISPYWDTQIGIRQDTGLVPNNTWLAFGIQGLAPYWFHLDAEGYVTTQGQTSLRVEGSYDMYLTQRIVAQPRFEVNAYGKQQDPYYGSGLNNSSLGFRVRYEISRQFAPYIGVQWINTYGQTRTMAAIDGASAQQTAFIAGIRVWY